MASAVKHVVFAGNFATITGGAQTFTSANDSEGMKVYGDDSQRYSHMDVLLNVKTISGTSPTTQPSIQERFSDVGFVETANWGATITGTGKYMLCNEGQTGQTGVANAKYGFAGLGRGFDKQIVFTNGGTIGVISIDVYFIFYSS